MAFRTFDGTRTYDARVIDSAGAFLQGELERLDPTLHMPLANVTWMRDIPLREDVTLGDDFSSFANLNFSSPGGVNPTGKAWVGKTTNQITGIDVDLAKQITPLTPWAMEIAYTIMELESSMKVNRPVDNQKYEGMRLKYQMDLDEQSYVGDAGLGFYGLLNSPQVGATNVPNGTAGSPLWPLKSPQEILNDVNAVLNTAWQASGFTFVPTKLLLPPLKYSFINQAIVSTAGNRSITNYLRENSLAMEQNGRPLEIQPVKWLTGRGVGGTDRMVAYTQDQTRVRLPLTPLQNTPVQYSGLHYRTYYYCKVGSLEITQTELMAYMDGL